MTMQLFTTRQYFMIDIANNFGLDKLDWNDRLAWVEENQDRLMSLKDEAEEPAQYYKALMAYYTVLKTGQSKAMMGLDATASGFQLIGALFNDITLMRNSNVLDTGKRMDAYSAVTDQMKELLNDDSFEIARSDAKSACMKGGYGSTKAPEEVFGTGSLLTTFYQAVALQAPSSIQFNEFCLSAWDSDALEYTWSMPDAFVVNQKVMDKLSEDFTFQGKTHITERYVNRSLKRGRSLGANTIHAVDSFVVREMVRMCNYNTLNVERATQALQYNGRRSSTKDDEMVIHLANLADKFGILSARILDHVSSFNIGFVNKDQLFDLLSNLPNEPFPLSTIHDCFFSYHKNMNRVRKLYNYQLFRLAQSNVLNVMMTLICKRRVNFKKMDSSMNYKILEANYALS